MTDTDITLDWLDPLNSSTGQYSSDYSWVYQVNWGTTTATVPQDPGIYVIQNNNGEPVYAGKAKAGLAKRFNLRTKSLREYELSTQASDPVAGYTLYLATTRTDQIRKAEKWLIRFLRVADDNNTNHVLQNIKDTKSKLRVNKGDTLSITHDGNLPPFFRQTVYTYNGPKNI